MHNHLIILYIQYQASSVHHLFGSFQTVFECTHSQVGLRYSFAVIYICRKDIFKVKKN